MFIEEERTKRAGDPERETKIWAEKIAGSDRLRAAYQDQQAACYMTLTELGSKISELEVKRKLVQTELEHLLAHKERVEELERDRGALLESYTETVPDALGNLSGQERNRLYGMLRVEARPASEGLEVSGAFCTPEPPQQLRNWTGFPGRRGHGESPIKERLGSCCDPPARMDRMVL